jgi:hypothetical protein
VFPIDLTFTLTLTRICQVEMLLDTFTNLFSIRFRLRSECEFIYPGEIIAYQKTLMRGGSSSHSSSSVSIWMDLRVETTDTCKSLNVSHGGEDV